MFVRFRARALRLYVSLAESRRSNGTVRQHHVASLGVVSLDPAALKWVAVKERSAVWQELHDNIARLSLDATKAAQLMAAVQARVPYPTPEETGNAELLEAEHDAAFWENMHGSTTKLIGCHEGLIAAAPRKIAELQDDAAREAASAESAKAKTKRLDNYRAG